MNNSQFRNRHGEVNTVDLDNIAGIVLAAGRGERLRPLTDSLPKPLVLIGSETLLDAAVASMPLAEEAIAVNAHYLADQIVDYLCDRPIHVATEAEPLGSGGAVSNLRDWVGDRHVMVRNADMWFDRVPAALWAGWSGENPRLLVTDTGTPSDFGTARFLGWSLLPQSFVRGLPSGRSALLDEVWHPAYQRGALEFVFFTGLAIDAGTLPDLERVRRLIEFGQGGRLL